MQISAHDAGGARLSACTTEAAVSAGIATAKCDAQTVGSLRDGNHARALHAEV